MDGTRVFRDAYGQIIGTAETEFGHTVFRDRFGQIVASESCFDAAGSSTTPPSTMDAAAGERRFCAAVTADVIVVRSHADAASPSGVGSQDLLLIRRRGEPDRGMWAFPGGHMEASDGCIEEAAARELREETGLVAKELRPVGVLSQQSEMDRPCICHVFVYPFWADGSSGDEARGGDDAEDATWFSVDVRQKGAGREYDVRLTAKDGPFRGKTLSFTASLRRRPIGCAEIGVEWHDDSTAGRLAFDHAHMLSRAVVNCRDFLNISVAD